MTFAQRGLTRRQFSVGLASPRDDNRIQSHE